VATILFGLGLSGVNAVSSNAVLQTTAPNIGVVKRVGSGVLVGSGVWVGGGVFVGSAELVGNAVLVGSGVKVNVEGIGVGVTCGNSASNVLATRVARAQTVLVPATSVAIAFGVGAGSSKLHASNKMSIVKQVINRNDD
jgi:hypothetical protein